MCAALHGEKRDALERAAREAVRHAVFLVALALHPAIQLMGLRYAALFWQMRAISAEAQLQTAGPSRGPSGGHTARWAGWRGGQRA